MAKKFAELPHADRDIVLAFVTEAARTSYRIDRMQEALAERGGEVAKSTGIDLVELTLLINSEAGKIALAGGEKALSPGNAPFNGYVVSFWNHETRDIETAFYDEAAIMKAFHTRQVPKVSDVVEDLFEIYGDRVRTVRDFDGALLYANFAEH